MGDVPDAVFVEYRRTGAVELRNRLVEAHLVLARAFARRYADRGVPLEDLEQVARMSLIGAVERFDPDVGVRFSTFAGRTMDGELKRYFRDRAWSVRVPRQYQDLGVAIRGALDRLATELGRVPTIAELATAVGAEVDEVLAAMEAAEAFRADSIDAPVARQGEDQGVVADTLGENDRGPCAFEDRELVRGLLDRLPPRERRIMELRFFEERSQREIADDVGVSQMHVSRLIRRSIADLRAMLDTEP